MSTWSLEAPSDIDYTVYPLLTLLKLPKIKTITRGAFPLSSVMMLILCTCYVMMTAHCIYVINIHVVYVSFFIQAEFTLEELDSRKHLLNLQVCAIMLSFSSCCLL